MEQQSCLSCTEEVDNGALFCCFCNCKVKDAGCLRVPRYSKSWWMFTAYLFLSTSDSFICHYHGRPHICSSSRDVTFPSRAAEQWRSADFRDCFIKEKLPQSAPVRMMLPRAPTEQASKKALFVGDIMEGLSWKPWKSLYLVFSQIKVGQTTVQEPGALILEQRGSIYGENVKSYIQPFNCFKKLIKANIWKQLNIVAITVLGQKIRAASSELHGNQGIIGFENCSWLCKPVAHTDKHILDKYVN